MGFERGPAMDADALRSADPGSCAPSPESRWFVLTSRYLVPAAAVDMALARPELQGGPLAAALANMRAISRSDASFVCLPTREDAEGCFAMTFPYLRSTPDAPGMVELRDVAMGVLDFRDEPHPVRASSNLEVGYDGAGFVYADVMASRSTIVGPKPFLWSVAGGVREMSR